MKFDDNLILGQIWKYRRWQVKAEKTLQRLQKKRAKLVPPSKPATLSNPPVVGDLPEHLFLEVAIMGAEDDVEIYKEAIRDLLGCLREDARRKS